MEILGVGLPEIMFVLLLALILLGPKDMVKAGRTIGRSLRKFIMSPAWQAMRTTGKELQQLPTKLMREAGLDELQEIGNEVQAAAKENLVELQSVEKQILAAPDPLKPVSPPKGQEPAPKITPAPEK